MKPLALLFCSNLFAQIVFGQVTISGNQFTHANSSNSYEQAAPIWDGGQALIDQSGENQTWSISDWLGVNPATETFVPVTQTPTLYQFFFNTPFLYPDHVSTHALGVDQVDTGFELPIEFSDAFTYFRNDANGYFATGSAFSVQGLPIATRNTVVERIYPWPLEYGLEFTGEGSYLTELITFGAYGQESQRNGVVDGWGSFEGPFGSFEVLRIRTEIAITDTIFIEQFGGGQSIVRPLQINYTWISPEREGPIMEISVINDQIFSARLLTNGINLSTAQEAFEAEIRLFPNPASDGFNLTWGDGLPLEVQLFDAQGRQVYSDLITPGFFARKEIPTGLFIMRFARQGETLGSKKVVFTE